jgi:hypothetical protein
MQINIYTNYELNYTRITIVPPVHTELDLLGLVQSRTIRTPNQYNNEANRFQNFFAPIMSKER